MANGRITDRVNDMIADFLAENGYELWDMRYVKEGREHYCWATGPSRATGSTSMPDSSASSRAAA